MIVEASDLYTACDLLSDTMIFKTDELLPGLRSFFERLKSYICEQAPGDHKQQQFTLREIRNAMRLSKTQCFRYTEELMQLEYLQKAGGSAKLGYKYRIVSWDEAEQLRLKLKEQLDAQMRHYSK